MTLPGLGVGVSRRALSSVAVRRLGDRTVENPLMDIENLPDMLRVDEAAAVLRISRSRAYDEVAAFQRTGGAEGLPAIRIGRTLRVPKRALLDWIDAQLGGPNAA